jgi:hypothetical protein
MKRVHVNSGFRQISPLTVANFVPRPGRSRQTSNLMPDMINKIPVSECHHTENSALMVIALGWHVTAGRRKPVGQKELLILFVGNFGMFDFEQTPWLKTHILRSPSTISR